MPYDIFYYARLSREHERTVRAITKELQANGINVSLINFDKWRGEHGIDRIPDSTVTNTWREMGLVPCS